MESLYTKINETKQTQKETRKIEKLIQNYINKKDVKKLILKGFKKRTSMFTKIDDVTIELEHRFIPSDYSKSYFIYKFNIKQNKNEICSLRIKPSSFNIYLQIKMYHFDKKIITSQQILDYLKIIIGID